MNQIQKLLAEAVIQDCADMWKRETGKSLAESLKDIYSSRIISSKLTDEETGLYSQSSMYVYGLFKDEYLNGKILQNEI